MQPEYLKMMEEMEMESVAVNGGGKKEGSSSSRRSSGGGGMDILSLVSRGQMNSTLSLKSASLNSVSSSSRSSSNGGSNSSTSTVLPDVVMIEDMHRVSQLLNHVNIQLKLLETADPTTILEAKFKFHS